ncbi:MAG: hypothetical protein ACRD19_10000 [Terriglobia bacterium]
MRITLQAACGLLAIAIAPALSQTVRSGSIGAIIPAGRLPREMVMRGGVSFAEPMGHPTIGKPYSAERIVEHTQTLADGTHIKQIVQRVKLYRDSEGRTRIETIPTLPNGATPKVVFIRIFDPVAGYLYVLNAGAHTARRVPWPLGHIVPPQLAAGSEWFTKSGHSTKVPAAPPPPAKTSARSHPTMTRERLGPQEIDGLTAQGWRITTTYPVGFFGNDGPVTTTAETWTSPELGMVVLS